MISTDHNFVISIIPSKLYKVVLCLVNMNFVAQTLIINVIMHGEKSTNKFGNLYAGWT